MRDERKNKNFLFDLLMKFQAFLEIEPYRVLKYEHIERD